MVGVRVRVRVRVGVSFGGHGGPRPAVDTLVHILMLGLVFGVGNVAYLSVDYAIGVQVKGPSHRTQPQLQLQP